MPRKSAPDSLGAKVAVLATEMAESRRNSEEFKDLLAKQLDQLMRLREESRLVHQDLQNIVKNHEERLDAIEPAIHQMQSLRDRAWGVGVALFLLVIAVGTGISQALRWVLMKMGVDLP